MPSPLPFKVTLGVTGGIAAYKAAEIVRALQQHSLDVHVVMTRAAEEFVRPLTFASLTGHKVITSIWETDAYDDAGIEHISEAQSTNLLLVAPATAHTLAKFAHGLADDFLSTLYLATTAPVMVAPAMNVNMWNHAATQANLDHAAPARRRDHRAGQRLPRLRHDRQRTSRRDRCDRCRRPRAHAAPRRNLPARSRR